MDSPFQELNGIKKMPRKTKEEIIFQTEIDSLIVDMWVDCAKNLSFSKHLYGEKMR
jgi:hypothetical protein